MKTLKHTMQILLALVLFSGCASSKQFNEFMYGKAKPTLATDTQDSASTATITDTASSQPDTLSASTKPATATPLSDVKGTNLSGVFKGKVQGGILVQQSKTTAVTTTAVDTTTSATKPATVTKTTNKTTYKTVTYLLAPTVQVVRASDHAVLSIGDLIIGSRVTLTVADGFVVKIVFENVAKPAAAAVVVQPKPVAVTVSGKEHPDDNEKEDAEVDD
jgi:hypothetical protein